VYGLRSLDEGFIPPVLDESILDRKFLVSSSDALRATRELTKQEGIFAGISSGGALWAAIQVSAEVHNAVIVVIVCDRGDRYLSTGVFPA
jgi:cysteine synthase B